MSDEVKRETGRHTITINKINDEAKVALKTRIISAIVGLAVVIPAVIMGDWIFFALMIAIIGIASWEIVHCAKKKYSIWLYIFTAVAMYALCFWPVFRKLFTDGMIGQGHIYSYFDSLYISFLIIVLSMFALFYIVMWDENFTITHVCYILTVGTLTALGFQSLCFIRFYPALLQGNTEGFYNVTNTFGSMLPMIYFLIAVFFTDIGAYFTGMLFGKKKINPRISPKKTWAGFFGGLIISTVLSATFGIVLAACGNPILPVQGGFSIFDLDHWYNILLLSALIPPFATLGDFVFSAVKRYFETKDFGKIMPGHGGVMDRADSIIFAALVMAIFIVVVEAICYGEVNPLL